MWSAPVREVAGQPRSVGCGGVPVRVRVAAGQAVAAWSVPELY